MFTASAANGETSGNKEADETGAASVVAGSTVTASSAETASSVEAFAASIGPSQSDLDHSAVATNTWLMTNKSYDGQRYVALDQINPTNVVRLKEICTFDTGVRAPAQSSPLL